MGRWQAIADRFLDWDFVCSGKYVFGPENGALPIGSGRFAGWRNTASFIGAGGVRKQIMCLPRNGVTKQFRSFRGNYVTIPWMTSPADDGWPTQRLAYVRLPNAIYSEQAKSETADVLSGCL